MSARVYYRHKSDKLKKPVVELLRKANVPFWDINGTFDLAVGITMFNRGVLGTMKDDPPKDWKQYVGSLTIIRTIELWELKSGEKSPLKPSQVEFLKQWQGFPVYVIRSVEEAARRIGI